MIKRRRFPKIFFGWWTVLASGLLALWGQGYRMYGFSALFIPISSEFGFSRAATSVAASIARLEGGIEAPVTGWITDRYGPRWIVVLGVFLIGLGLVMMNYINSLWAYWIVWGVILGTGVNIGLTVPLDTAIANWFVKKRGIAISIKWVFSGLSGVIVLPLIAWLIVTQGWRMTCVIGGVVMWLGGLPLAWFCLRRYRPEYYGLLPDGATVEDKAAEAGRMIEKGVKYATEVEEVEFTLRQSMRTPTYWVLIMVQAVHGLVAPVINFHCIPFLIDMGIDPLKAAGMMALMISCSIPSRFLGGLIGDRVKTSHLRFVIGCSHLLRAVGFTVFLLNQTIPMIYVWFVLYGLGLGINYPLNTIIGARYFGRKALGSIRGTSMFFLTPIGVIAPIYAGWVFDTTGSYITVFVTLAAALAFAAALMPFASPPRPPAVVSDIRKIA